MQDAKEAMYNKALNGGRGPCIVHAGYIAAHQAVG